MEGLSREQLLQVLEFYKLSGLKKDSVVKNGEILDIYRILGIKPEIDENGNRKLSPYELLKVPPQIVNGKERPIVFAIKNKVKKIGKYTGEITEFVYASHKVKDEHSILETLKKKYKDALLMGNEAEAEKYLNLINDVTGGGADEFLDSFYDYTKFYRRMKKQLILDLFAHFFLLFMSARSLTIQKGLLKTDKVYHAYKEYDEEQALKKQEEEIQSFVQDFANKHGEGMFPQLTNVSFKEETDVFDDPKPMPAKEEFKVDGITQQMPVPPPPPPMINEGSAEENENLQKNEPVQQEPEKFIVDIPHPEPISFDEQDMQEPTFFEKLAEFGFASLEDFESAITSAMFGESQTEIVPEIEKTNPEIKTNKEEQSNNKPQEKEENKEVLDEGQLDFQA